MNAGAVTAALLQYTGALDAHRALAHTLRLEGRLVEAEGAERHAEWVRRAIHAEIEAEKPLVTTPALLCVSGHDPYRTAGGVRCTRCDYRQGQT